MKSRLPMVRASIVNVIATADLRQRIDLDKLGKLTQIQRNAKRYGGRVAYFRSRSIKGMVSIFSSGKMISVGGRSEAEAFHALEVTKSFLIKKGFVLPVALENKTHNIVAVADFAHSINLEEMAEDRKIIYEPEQFPGGILKIGMLPKATALIYANGKIVIVGLRSSAEIEPFAQKLKDIIERYT